MKYFKENKNVFAKGICFDKLFAIFIIGSIIGSFYEEILNLLLVYSKTGNIVWEYRRGVIYGPFNVIYGFGAVIIVSLLVDKNHKWYQTILYGALLGGGIEYFIGFLQETFTNSISWDYSNQVFNFNGRTSILYCIVWGALGVVFIKFVYPYFDKIFDKVLYKVGAKIITAFAVVFMIFNISISSLAVQREYERRENIEAESKMDIFLDKHFPDDILDEVYKNRIEK